VASKRGFFAELQHQNKVAARKKQQAATAAYRANVAAQKRAEQAQRQAERAQAHQARASAAEQKAAEREAKRLHDEAMLAQAEAMNAQLEETYDEIDSILAATLSTDDFVDVESLREIAVYPEFTRSDLETPNPQPDPIIAPPEPQYIEPDAPKGLGAVFGGKKKHAEHEAQAIALHATALEEWQAQVATIPTQQLAQMQEHQSAEERREKALNEARRLYQAECDKRDLAAATANESLDELIVGLAENREASIQDYVGIVLGNSVYPERFQVDHEFAFDSTARELTLTVIVPPPGDLPTEKIFRYVKASDEISSTTLPKRDQKDRYADAVYQVGLRSLHEVFEADRDARIQTIALTVASEGLDPATGLQKRTDLVAVAADRESFTTFDLANIVPLATLQHLGASISKNPFEMIGIDGSQGVRGV
jgi:restriction system protein